jgi:hypothetical protein
MPVTLKEEVTMQYPQIDKVFGTHPEDLIKDYTLAQKACEEAIKALAGVWPHQRDYQGGDIRQATHQHTERCKSLRTVALDMQLIIESILHQIAGTGDANG